MMSIILRIVEENTEFTLTQINATFRASLPNKPHISDNTVSNILHGQMVRLKKI